MYVWCSSSLSFPWPLISTWLWYNIHLFFIPESWTCCHDKLVQWIGPNFFLHHSPSTYYQQHRPVNCTAQIKRSYNIGHIPHMKSKSGVTHWNWNVYTKPLPLKTETDHLLMWSGYSCPEVKLTPQHSLTKTFPN